MRWQAAWMCALSLVLLTGCPEEYGKDGTMDRAVHQDVMELQRKYDCSKDDYARLCAGGREQSAECLKKCGG